MCTSHPRPCTESTEKTAGHFLLSAKEQHRLTLSAMKFMVTSVKKLISDVHKDIESAMVSKLPQHGINTEELDLEVDISNPFDGLEVEHMRTKFFQTNFGLVAGPLIFIYVIRITGLFLSVGMPTYITTAIRRGFLQGVPVLHLTNLIFQQLFLFNFFPVHRLIGY